MNNNMINSMDPNILISMVNMKLRDFYSSLENMVEDLDLDINMLVSRLESAGYKYNREINQFK